MSVVIDGKNILVRKATIGQRLRGGVQEYQQLCPNRAFCTGGEITRIGFMFGEDGNAFLEYLVSLGFVRPTERDSQEVALVHEKDLVFPPIQTWLTIR